MYNATYTGINGHKSVMPRAPAVPKAAVVFGRVEIKSFWFFFYKKERLA
jgi:hypothetical protein